MLKNLHEIAVAAGKEILSFYGQDNPVEAKSDKSPLTLADQAAHHFIVNALNEAFPEIPVLSEESDPESGQDRKSWQRFWLVDPLDGTKEFIKQTGYFTVNIALIEESFPISGIIHCPVKDLTYHASRGEGAWKLGHGSSPERIQSVQADLTAPRIVASRDHAGPEVARLLNRFPGHSCLSIGSSLKFCMVAEGEADVYLRDVPTMEWDVGAAQIIVEEAGGKVLRLDTLNPLTYNKPDLRNPPLLTMGRSIPAEWGF